MSHISWMEVFETNQILNAMIMVNQKQHQVCLISLCFSMAYAPHVDLMTWRHIISIVAC